MERHDTLTVPAEMTVSDRIRIARVAAGLTQKELADLLEMPSRTFWRIEAGLRPARRGELIAIAQFTGQELEFFGASLDGEGPVLPPPLPQSNVEAA